MDILDILKSLNIGSSLKWHITFGRLYEGIFKIRYMEELIKLREFCFTEKEKAYQKGYRSALWTLSKPVTIRQRGKVTAFSAVIKQLDLILNNSCVKPCERRSPTDETFNGCKPPERKAKSTEKIDNNKNLCTFQDHLQFYSTNNYSCPICSCIL